jgi:hypothetical protein
METLCISPLGKLQLGIKDKHYSLGTRSTLLPSSRTTYLDRVHRLLALRPLLHQGGTVPIFHCTGLCKVNLNYLLHHKPVFTHEWEFPTIKITVVSLHYCQQQMDQVHLLMKMGRDDVKDEVALEISLSLSVSLSLSLSLAVLGFESSNTCLAGHSTT